MLRAGSAQAKAANDTAGDDLEKKRYADDQQRYEEAKSRFDNEHPTLPGALRAALERARVILWQGHCSVHAMFRPEHVDAMRRNLPGVRILVHPECSMEVVDKADLVGSTSYILRQVEQAAVVAVVDVDALVNVVVPGHVEQVGPVCRPGRQLLDADVLWCERWRVGA